MTGTRRHHRCLRLGLAVALTGITTAACGGQAAWQQTAAGPSESAAAKASTPATASASQSATAAAGAALPVNLCSLLAWSDLGYPGIAKGTPSPTEANRLSGWSQSCFWASQQFVAGYTPPHDAQCDSADSSSNASIAMECVGVDAKEVASIISHSQWVKLIVAWRSGLTNVSPVSYEQDGNPVYLSVDSSSCTGGLNWANGTLVVENQDTTKAFGPPCDEVKKVIALLVKRTPS